MEIAIQHASDIAALRAADPEMSEEEAAAILGARTLRQMLDSWEMNDEQRSRTERELAELHETIDRLYGERVSIESLSRQQGVGPCDLKNILGTWPGEPDDGFEQAVADHRRGADNQHQPHSR